MRNVTNYGIGNEFDEGRTTSCLLNSPTPSRYLLIFAVFCFAKKCNPFFYGQCAFILPQRYKTCIGLKDLYHVKLDRRRWAQRKTPPASAKIHHKPINQIAFSLQPSAFMFPLSLSSFLDDSTTIRPAERIRYWIWVASCIDSPYLECVSTIR